MLPIAGQMAGLIGLKFIVDAPRVKGKKKKFQIFFPRPTPGPSACT